MQQDIKVLSSVTQKRVLLLQPSKSNHNVAKKQNKSRQALYFTYCTKALLNKLASAEARLAVMHLKAF